jgi:UDP-glucose 4-epimerase
MMHLAEDFRQSSEKTAIYNVGSRDRITVEQIAKIVAKETGYPKIRLRFTGGVDGGRGWRGDVKNMQLSIQKLLGTGWKPRYSSEQAVKLAAQELARQFCGN